MPRHGEVAEVAEVASSGLEQQQRQRQALWLKGAYGEGRNGSGDFKSTSPALPPFSSLVVVAAADESMEDAGRRFMSEYSVFSTVSGAVDVFFFCRFADAFSVVSLCCRCGWFCFSGLFSVNIY